MKSAILILTFGLTCSLGAQVTDQQLLNSPSQDWLTYNGGYNSQRNSSLDQIRPSNVHRLAAQWAFHVNGGAARRCSRYRLL
jgi:glucose dehydrogenase